MRLFLSWSGERSLDFAKAIRDWIILVLGDKIDFFLSEDDVSAGQRWTKMLAETLDEADLGLICLTSDSISSQWIGFEAGWLARRLEDGSVIPLLLDVEPSEVSGPLATFQSKKADLKGMLDIIAVINSKLPSAEDSRLVAERAKLMFANLKQNLEPIVQWGKRGISVEYTAISELPDLQQYYDAAEAMILRATKSIAVLTSGYYDQRQSQPADIEAHKKFTSNLSEHLKNNPEVSYREIFQFATDAENTFTNNEGWMYHLRLLAQLAIDRKNVNLREMVYSPSPRLDSFLIVDLSAALIENCDNNTEYPDQKRHTVSLISIRDSDNIIPQKILADFDSYWNRGTQDVWINGVLQKNYEADDEKSSEPT